MTTLRKEIERAGINAVQKNKYAREAYMKDIVMLKSILSAMPDEYKSADYYPDEETFSAAEKLLYWSMRVSVDLQQIDETNTEVSQAKEMLYKCKYQEADNVKGGENHAD